MKAVIFEKIGSVKLAEISKPKLLNPDDALVKITSTAICGTDLHIINGNIPVEEDFVIGHEAVGIVEEIGNDVKKVKPNDRVVVSCTVQCGFCVNCRRGVAALCEKGGIFGCGKARGGFAGAQAEYMRVPYADMVLEPIPDNISDDEALFVGDILSTGYMAAENGCIRPGDIVAIFGSGPVGLCTLACAKLFGASKIINVDLLDYRLEEAQRLGADIVINANNTDPVEEIKNATKGRGADVTIEAIGDPKTLQACINSVRGGGNISIVGVFPPGVVEISMKEMLIQNLTIKMGLVNVINMGKLLTLIMNGKLDVTSLITHRLDLDDAEDAYHIFQKVPGRAQGNT
ncbi:MAG: alcohol dehydrogenase catalytic domain-containing protein [Deltaproteobacteria bacterium]|nr:alcohol dehydrogenase catalytic domain-containing protein [Deltaproteobacteria bacterium]